MTNTDVTDVTNYFARRRQMAPIINRAVRNARAAQPDTLNSYLHHAASEEEIEPMIAALRRNHPAIFTRQTL
jgi:hypothetical protein